MVRPTAPPPLVTCLLVLQAHDINVRGRDLHGDELEESDSTDDEVDTDTDTGDEHGQNPPPTPCVAGACAAAAARLNAAQVDLVAAQVCDVVGWEAPAVRAGTVCEERADLPGPYPLNR